MLPPFTLSRHLLFFHYCILSPPFAPPPSHSHYSYRLTSYLRPLRRPSPFPLLPSPLLNSPSLPIPSLIHLPTQVAIRAVPYRADFYARLLQGGDRAKLDAELGKWLHGLDALVKHMCAVVEEGGYGKV